MQQKIDVPAALRTMLCFLSAAQVTTRLGSLGSRNLISEAWIWDEAWIKQISARSRITMLILFCIFLRVRATGLVQKCAPRRDIKVPLPNVSFGVIDIDASDFLESNVGVEFDFGVHRISTNRQDLCTYVHGRCYWSR